MQKENREDKISFRDARKIFSWYWKLTKQFSFWLYIVMAAYGIAAISSQVYLPVLLKDIVDNISGKAPGFTVSLQQQLALFAILVIIQNIFFRLGDRGLRKYQVPARAHIAEFLFLMLQKQSYSFFSNSLVGSLISRSWRFENGFTTLSEGFIFTIWWQTIVIIGMFISLAIISWPLALIFSIAMLVLFLITIPLLKKKMVYDEQEGEVSSKLTGYFSDVLTNILNLKIFSNASFERKRFGEITQERARKDDLSQRAGNIMVGWQAVLGESVGVCMLIIVVWLWSRGEVTAGTVLLTTSYSAGLFHMVFQFTRSISKMLQALANAKEMVDIFEQVPEIQDPKKVKKIKITEGKLIFSDVNFSYAEGKQVFEKFNIEVKSKEKVGLVGPSGGGKSTVTKLLLRFLDVNLGKITIDGFDVREMKQDDLRNVIAYVPQDPLLFHRTLRENISYSKPGATSEEVIAAAKKAHAHEFIESLEKGYDTEVGERGVKLSGGQRQRIAIARAILKDAPILVMDEATSALDTVSEKAIRDSLSALMANKTVLIIAHRLSTVEKLDRIIVLDRNGVICEQGTHQELLDHNGLYAILWNHQVGGFLSEEEGK